MEEGFDLSRLIQVAVVFVFFVLPVLKNIAAAKTKEGEEKQARPRAPKPDSAGQDVAGRDKRGREAWERLLRGEPSPEKKPEPPPQVQGKPRPKRRDQGPLRETAAPAGRPSILSEETPLEPSEGRGLAPPAPSARSPRSARGSARRDRISEREDVTGGLGADASFEEHELESSPRAAAGMGPGLGRGLGQGAGSLAVSAPVAGGLASARRRARAGTSLRGLDARAWRRAVLTAEVLSPPLGLRDRPAWPGSPTGS